MLPVRVTGWDNEAIWAATRETRRTLADVLATLPASEWDAPSLCPGWRVREVVAHLVLGPSLGRWKAIWEVLRRGGNFNRMVLETARERSAAEPQQLVADFEAVIDSRRHPPGTFAFDPLVDALVHTQDIAIPLGRTVAMPAGPAAAAATFVWGRGFPFGAKRRFRGLRIEATDTDWVRGGGLPVRGPIASVLLACTGRAAGLRELDGAGVETLRSRLNV
ncbi:maleylpyruvate isomerase family mycothiol-dependent enzyme [Aldersonia sp. NBC_00410]|uniref:maleylpyruvate isomerase family mycothiol-dependent enzyme n=1 Tax=Aldersonia sp. NBC_00410 TaxID=2975954 RepID=UPI0022597704|nr:maleylpyruvate isomerase family mycothiol-dependent enzyme [Aldersonia sp. NBC_00410]MCX5045900.1 maleylpyruvate isomerase family mycothiol-dependent enzyme [Aldersonia sp. NBC_00410]